MVAPLLQEKDAGEDSDRAEPQDGHNLAVANAGIERDLQRCLHRGKERRGARVSRADAHDIGGRDDEATLCG